jgi:hypothetical protein
MSHLSDLSVEKTGTGTHQAPGPSVIVGLAGINANPANALLHGEGVFRRFDLGPIVLAGVVADAALGVES